ncbi:MAG: hypothetical protein HC809_11240 [Gammaproteobacteria bacterium]|nr:hypothetical protein [Gammaproteobacteria bacterium]
MIDATFYLQGDVRRPRTVPQLRPHERVELQMGRLSVDVFFMISGYLIPFCLLKHGSARAFLANRASRRVPDLSRPAPAAVRVDAPRWNVPDPQSDPPPRQGFHRFPGRAVVPRARAQHPASRDRTSCCARLEIRADAGDVTVDGIELAGQSGLDICRRGVQLEQLFVGALPGCDCVFALEAGFVLGALCNHLGFGGYNPDHAAIVTDN